MLYDFDRKICNERLTPGTRLSYFNIYRSLQNFFYCFEFGDIFITFIIKIDFIFIFSILLRIIKLNFGQLNHPLLEVIIILI